MPRNERDVMKPEPSKTLRQFITEHHAPVLAAIRLYAIRARHDLNGAMLAQELGISPGAAMRATSDLPPLLRETSLPQYMETGLKEPLLPVFSSSFTQWRGGRG